MNHISKMFAQMADLDAYTQMAVFGSWQYAVNSACIRQASKFVPDAPISTGIEELTPYEAARRALIREAETSRLPALLSLQREVVGLMYGTNGTPRQLEDTLQLMTEKGPTREQFGREYDERKALGMRPVMSRRQFIDAEFEQATKAFNALIAKGEDAVRLCETISIEDSRGFNDLPDWVGETFLKKMIEKLHNRWERLERDRTNPRKMKMDRDIAAASQQLIEKVLAEYGETPTFEDDDTPDPSDVAQMREQAHSLADMPNDLDPTKPGPVTVTRFKRAPEPTA